MLSQMVSWPMAAGAFLVGMFVYYRKVVVRPVVLHAKEGGKLDRFLRNHLDILKHKYWPTFWCFESRMQTVLASMTRRMIPYIHYRREESISNSSTVQFFIRDVTSSRNRVYPQTRESMSNIELETLEFIVGFVEMC